MLTCTYGLDDSTKSKRYNCLTSARSLVSHCHSFALATSCRLQNTLVSIILTISSTYRIFNFGALFIARALGPAIGIRNTLSIVLAYLVLARIYRKTRTSAMSVQLDFTTLISLSTYHRLPLTSLRLLKSLRRAFNNGRASIRGVYYRDRKSASNRVKTMLMKYVLNLPVFLVSLTINRIHFITFETELYLTTKLERNKTEVQTFPLKFTFALL